MIGRPWLRRVECLIQRVGRCAVFHRRQTVLVWHLAVGLAAVAAVLPAVETCTGPSFEAELASLEAQHRADASTRRLIGERATLTCPLSEAAHLMLGRALEDLGDLQGAEQAYRQAAVVDPDSAVPWARLAHLAHGRGNQAEYEVYLETAQALAVTAAEVADVGMVAPDCADTVAGGEYIFKEADDIQGGLQIGAKSIRPKSLTGDYGDDYFAGRAGLGVNLGILFEVGSTVLQPDGARQLRELGKALQRSTGGERYLVEGHSSSEGDRDFNERLSRSRAQAIIEILVGEYGVSGLQLEPVGRGIDFPVVENGSENKRKSRRVTVLRLYDE